MNLEPLHELIKTFEGLRLKPYLCPAGVPTIGYGATRYPRGRAVSLQDKPITEEEAENMLIFDAQRYAMEAIKLSPVLAHDDEKLCAIADFIYNLGATRYKASTLRRRVNDEDWHGACEQLRKWIWGGGKKLSGLVRRREAEIALILRGAK